MVRCAVIGHRSSAAVIGRGWGLGCRVCALCVSGGGCGGVRAGAGFLATRSRYVYTLLSRSKRHTEFQVCSTN